MWLAYQPPLKKWFLTWFVVQGRELNLDIFAYTDGENTRPLPFRARFNPRSEKIAEILEKERDNAEQFLARYNGETKLTLADVS